MSRSKRQTQICGITVAESEKKDKRIANRCLRRKSRALLATSDIAADETVLPVMRDVSNVWKMEKDGKQWLSDANCKEMRK